MIEVAQLQAGRMNDIQGLPVTNIKKYVYFSGGLEIRVTMIINKIKDSLKMRTFFNTFMRTINPGY